MKVEKVKKIENIRVHSCSRYDKFGFAIQRINFEQSLKTLAVRQNLYSDI